MPSDFISALFNAEPKDPLIYPFSDKTSLRTISFHSKLKVKFEFRF